MPQTISNHVAEIQGLYGPVTVSEKLIQRLWLRGDYQKDTLKTESGKSIIVKRPGRWNMQEGPDFIGAELMINGKPVNGDVELHFYARDWFAHQHHEQRRFDKVVLHVVVFPPPSNAAIHTLSGYEPETLVLLPHMSVDLEAYAADEAMREWESRDSASILEKFLYKAPEEREHQIIENARKRFFQKVAFARKRLDKSGSEQAYHQMTLEILGYRRNRSPMSTIAEAYKARTFLSDSPEDIFKSQQEHWKLSGLRPANHPRKRLEQYAKLLRDSPDWVTKLQAWGKAQRISEGTFSKDTKAYRRTKRLTAQRREIADIILAGAIGGTRLDTWAIDGLIPLLAISKPNAWFPLWFHWFPGDMPDAVSNFLQHCELPEKAQPRSNGWLQGAWQIFLESGL
ncbi:DUF2851 family protein [Rubellicoccus peritrichatus]|uniref:DUF2851 family protein n=1 Tax=Rubellicoccus peritrichatus TaxID=3080537 RepID=A0AAQ3L533_9BACT|nr:DUF2851 family protein [Puniceicoccus sp. CR14]WOO39290.1 DUF2851 family protein [Puniceicoccus sp. CR14]